MVLSRSERNDGDERDITQISQNTIITLNGTLSALAPYQPEYDYNPEWHLISTNPEWHLISTESKSARPKRHIEGRQDPSMSPGMWQF